MQIKIGIAYHRMADFYNKSPYLPIQVGSARSEYSLGIQKDSDGDNISNDNAYCSEMSATYWLWKNIEADYKGLFHYRRFMTFQREYVTSIYSPKRAGCQIREAIIRKLNKNS